MSSNDWNDDIEDVEPLVDAEGEFLGALETLDVGKIMQCWSENDRASLIFPGIDMVKGGTQIRLAFTDVAAHTSSLRTVLRPVSIMRLGDLGWTFLTGSIISTHGDETLTIQVYITNVYCRESGGWKILHHHMSPAPHQATWFEQRLN